MKYILSFFLFFFLLFTMSGQSVRASVESAEVYLGQPFEFRIIIEGTTKSEVPQLAQIDGISMDYKGMSTSMVSSFGSGVNSSSKTITYSWSFTSTKTGSLTIPSFSIDIDGKIYKTASGTIKVKKPEDIEGYHLILETDKEEYWIGEPINLTIKWLFSSSVSNPLFNLPFIESETFSIESRIPPQGSDVYKLNISGLDVLAMQSAEIYKGEQYSTLSFHLNLQSGIAGVKSLGPITLSFDSAERTGGFRTSYNSLVIPSNKLSLAIKELPSNAYVKGKPMILSRGVLEIDSEATPGIVHIGDPITYSFSLKGAVSPDTIDPPSLNDFDELKLDFSIPERRSPGKIENDRVRFSQTIRAKNSKINSIPELHFPYFNIETGSVHSAVIPAVPIDVLMTDVVTSANLESTGYLKQDDEEELLLETNLRGLLYNYDIEKLKKNGRIGKINILKDPLIVILLFIPPLCFLLMLGYKKRKIFIKIYNRFSPGNMDFEEIYNSLKKENTIKPEKVIEGIKMYLSKYCQSDDIYASPDQIYNSLLDKKIDREVSIAVRDMLSTFEENEYSKIKKVLNGEEILNKFYSLSREFQ